MSPSGTAQQAIEDEMADAVLVCCGVVHVDCDEFVVGACCICATKDAAKGRTTKNLLAREDK